MHTLYLYLTMHKKEERIVIDDVHLNSILKKIPGIKWSQTLRRWHLPCSADAVNELQQAVKERQCWIPLY